MSETTQSSGAGQEILKIDTELIAGICKTYYPILTVMEGKFEPYVFPEYAEFCMINYHKAVPEIWPETNYFKWIKQGCSQGGKQYRGAPINDNKRILDLLHNDYKMFEAVRAGKDLGAITIWGLNEDLSRNKYEFELNGYHRLTIHQLLCIPEIKVHLPKGAHR